jgi:Ca2+-binding EF-hand superfamily protein
MTRKTIFIAAGVLLAAGAVAAVAQGHRAWRGGDEMHGGWHGERHGADAAMGRGSRWRGMTAEENDTRTRERFARLDRNSDGVIDTAEVEASIAARMSERRGRMGGRAEGGMGQRMLRRFDTNRDAKVTREEFDATVRKRFAELDLNSDGRISDEDLPPMMRGRNILAEGGIGRGRGGGMMGFVRGADANKDGVITIDEALAEAGKMFGRMDRTKDNVVETADFDLLRKEMTDYRVRRFIHSFGATQDGKITREQFDKVAKERFAQMDLDNDGRVTRDEMPSRGRWGGYGRGGDGDHGGPHHGRGPMMGPDDGAAPGTGLGRPGRN